MDRRGLLRIEPGGPDHHRHALLDGDLGVLDRRGRHGEVDQRIGAADRGAGVGHDLHALEAAMTGADARHVAGLATDLGVAGALQRARQGGALGAGDLADQHLAHAAGGAGDGDLHVFPLALPGLD